jgi:hypothetical protein
VETNAVLDESYLVRGLEALSRAHATDYFVDGHKGGAMVSAYYLCREAEVERGAAEAIAGMLDEHWARTDLCAPFPQEPADPALLDRIVAAMEKSIGRLRQAGHNVILPTLALKAFDQLPDAVTPSRVDGICKLIEAFDTADDITLDDSDDLPALDTPQRLAEAALGEMLRTVQAFLGRGQGWSGHMLTYARALIDLSRLGYSALASQGLHAFRLYITRTRMGPLATDKPRPEHPPSALRPLESRYWEARLKQPVGIGHCLKYPYGFYGSSVGASRRATTSSEAPESTHGAERLTAAPTR